MSIRADEAEKLYLQSKKKRLIQALHRIDADMNNVLQRGYKSIRTTYTTYEHNNSDILSDIVKYYNDLGWDVKNEGSGYLVISPSRRPAPPKVTAAFIPDFPSTITPSGSFGDFPTESQVNKMMGALNRYRETTLQFKPTPPPTRLVPEPSQFWSNVWDKVTLPFVVFWAWFKEVMK